MARRWIQSADVLVDDASGALVVKAGIEGSGKPCLLTWNAGTDNYAAPAFGSVAHDCTVLFIRVGDGGALVSIGDAAGQEKPYIIPPNYWREIVVAGGIPAGAHIVAKNLSAGTNFTDLAVEVR
jgi:hypothetical protein